MQCGVCSVNANGVLFLVRNAKLNFLVTSMPFASAFALIGSMVRSTCRICIPFCNRVRIRTLCLQAFPTVATFVLAFAHHVLHIRNLSFNLIFHLCYIRHNIRICICTRIHTYGFIHIHSHNCICIREGIRLCIRIPIQTYKSSTSPCLVPLAYIYRI